MRPMTGLMLAAMICAAPVRAAETAVFDLSIRGIPFGALTYNGEVQAGHYAVTGRLETTGFVAFIKKIRYDGQSQGAVSGKRFTPSRYVENADTGRRQSQAVMDYRQGIPQVKVYNPPKPPGSSGLDPKSQGGTVDPLTAMFVALRDVPAGQACDLVLHLYDGKRRSQVVLGPPVPGDGIISCPGEYRRIAGFSEADMAEKTRFPFTLYLTPIEGGAVRVTEVQMDSLYGKASLKRR